MTQDSLQQLRLSAQAADTRSASQVDLSLLWGELTQGGHRIIDQFFSEERCYLILDTPNNEVAHKLGGRRLAILEAVLSGLLQKHIAIDLALAPSTIALNSRLGLESLGTPGGKPSRAHPLLMLAARSATTGTPMHAKWSSFMTADDHELHVIGVARPDRRLSSLLPTAELAVTRRLIEGLSYADIARERGTSTRTIANQITAVFRRLRVSGRNDLVQRLFFDESLGRPRPKPITETIVPASGTVSRGSESWRDARRSA